MQTKYQQKKKVKKNVTYETDWYLYGILIADRDGDSAVTSAVCSSSNIFIANQYSGDAPNSEIFCLTGQHRSNFVVLDLDLVRAFCRYNVDVEFGV